MTFLDTGSLRNEEIQLVLEKTVEADPAKNLPPACYFAICNPAGTKMGICNLRLGHGEALYSAGNIGYEIDEPYQGRHYAGKACKLLFELARRQGMEYVIIVCAPSNQPSRKTCEWLGGELLEIVELPEDDKRRRLTGDIHRCIFRFDLGGEHHGRSICREAV